MLLYCTYYLHCIHAILPACLPVSLVVDSQACFFLLLLQAITNVFCHKAKARRVTGIQTSLSDGNMTESCNMGGPVCSSSGSYSPVSSGSGIVAAAASTALRDIGEAAVRRVQEMVKNVAAVHRDTGGRKLKSSMDQLAKQLATEAMGSSNPPVLLGR
jgi:hypothetical protein